VNQTPASDHLTVQAMPRNYRPLPSQERLAELFTYNRTTGLLRRKTGPNKGKAVGWRGTAGYLFASVDGAVYTVHRLIWCLVTGEDPGPRQIDHRNLKTGDNRWVNLRLATGSQNTGNTRKKSHNRSGYKGVSWSKIAGRWVAFIYADGRNRYLGYFDTREQAHAAYKAAADNHFGDYARGE